MKIFQTTNSPRSFYKLTGYELNKERTHRRFQMPLQIYYILFNIHLCTASSRYPSKDGKR